MRAVGSVLELSDVTDESVKSMAHAPHDERLMIVAERESLCERVVDVLRTIKERVERKDELLHGYERDLAKLRSVLFHGRGNISCRPGGCRTNNLTMTNTIRKMHTLWSTDSEEK